MRFKVISAGWECAPYLERTLESIAGQSNTNWDLGVAVDPGDDGTAAAVVEWLEPRRRADHEFVLMLNEQRRGAVRNQFELITALAPEPEDVIVFLDLDGDQLAHPDVLAHLEEYYADGTLVTYGNYRPVPATVGCQPPSPFPDDVVADRGYRHHVLRVYSAFNHLRTMKGKVFDAIPVDQFHWRRGSQRGDWYPAGTDYAFMVAALELADGRYKCIDEVLCLYNAANPHADHLRHGETSTRCHQDILRSRILDPLEV